MIHKIAHVFERLATLVSVYPVVIPRCRFCEEAGELELPSVSREMSGSVDRLLHLKRRAVADTDAHNKRFIKLLRERPFIEGVAIVLEDDPCLPCRQQSLVVSVHELPVLPWVRCTKREGCGCWYRPLDQAMRGSTSDWTRAYPMRSIGSVGLGDGTRPIRE